jgi:NADH dehydrogenase
MKILILGGSGQIGTVITREVVSAFPNAEVLSCSRSGKGQNGFKFNVFQEDWNSFGKIDAIINSVGIIAEEGDNTFEKIHIDVVQTIIKNRERMGNPKIIHISVLGADVTSKSGYASTKGEADAILKKEENVNIISPSFVCTPGTMMIGKLKMLHKMAKWQLNFLPCPAHFLTAKFQPIMGEDIAELAIQMIKQDLKGEHAYGTGPEIYSLEDWIDIVGKGRIKLIRIPKWLIDKPFRLITILFPFIMNKDQYILLGNDNVHENSDLKRILGREPKSTREFWEKELT